MYYILRDWFMGITKIKKRDGRVVDFNKSKISDAIFKAARAVGGKDRELAGKLADKVVEVLEKKLTKNSVPTVEQAQDLVEKVLIEEGHAKTAKAYILYREQRAVLRKEKAAVLEKDEIDEVDKRFDVNALRVLKARYLRKDETGKLVETPKELFTRIAVHTTIPELFYDAAVFNKNGGEQKHAEEEFDNVANEGKFSIGSYKLNRYHLEALKRLYDRHNKNGVMKVDFGEFLKLLKNGAFEKYEKCADDYFNLMAYKRFLPNTPAIANFGAMLGMGSACFVLHVGDSMESIMKSLTDAAFIFKAGGGVGYNFSNLRQEGDFVKSTCGVASGPLSFMSLFDKMTEVIKQGGIRRGANMGILNSNHPDIEKFVTAKEGNKQLKNFNISILVMGDFWKYYEANEPYPLVSPKTGQVVRYVNPKLLFDRVVYQAWESAEPGVIFFDKVNKYNPFFEHLGPIVTTNPCVTGDTLVKTETGTLSIKEIAEKYPNSGIKIAVDQRIQNGNLFLRGLSYVSEFKAFKTGMKETIKLITKSGKELKCTSDHRISTIEGWKEAEKLTIEDDILTEFGTDKLDRIEPNGMEDVYDITEPLTHSFIANGIVVHNCGEVLLYPNESCNLGSINAWAFSKEDDDENVYFDWGELADTIRTATRFLDNVIDVNKYPLQAIEDMTLETRKIGLGVMGVGDLLFELRLPYNTDDGRRFMEKLMEFINYHSKLESIELSKTRGILPLFDKSFYTKGTLPCAGAEDKNNWSFDWEKVSDAVKKYGVRNGFTTVIAPTGSISMIAGCSSGIEPVYSLAFEKNVKVGSFYYTDPVFEKVMRREGLYDEKLMEEVVKNGGTIQNIPYIPPKLKKVFVTATTITPEEHIRVLAAFQKWTDSSISKTNNFPADATVDDMRASYILAYKLGCKGVTVFRDGSIKDQVLVAGEAKKSKSELGTTLTKSTSTIDGAQKLSTVEKEIKVKHEEAVIPVEVGSQSQSLVTGLAQNTGTQLSNLSAPRETVVQLKTCPECEKDLVKKEGCLSCPECGWGLCK